jgi:hypothetical protein
MCGAAKAAVRAAGEGPRETGIDGDAGRRYEADTLTYRLGLLFQ